MIPKIRVFAEAGTKPLFSDGYDRDQMFYEIRDIDFYENDVTVWGCHRKDCGTCDYTYKIEDYTYKIEDVEVMQYTGCRDKNGIGIYEGDVIKDKYNKTWLVQWFVGAFVITDKIPDSDGQESTYSYFNDLSNHHFYFEVIGNIWEDGDLLEEIE